MLTKKELIEKHKTGIIQPKAIYRLSNTGFIAICDLDSEHVCGFISYGQDVIQKKDYFNVKVNYKRGGRAYFNVGKRQIHVSDCEPVINRHIVNKK